jgi:hypothetical protein
MQKSGHFVLISVVKEPKKGFGWLWAVLILLERSYDATDCETSIGCTWQITDVTRVIAPGAEQRASRRGGRAFCV